MLFLDSTGSSLDKEDYYLDIPVMHCYKDFCNFVWPHTNIYTYFIKLFCYNSGFSIIIEVHYIHLYIYL